MTKSKRKSKGKSKCN